MTSVRISSTGYRVQVVAEQRNEIHVEGEARVGRDGDRTTIDAVGGRLVVRVPEGTALVIGTTSGRVEVEGPAGSVAIITDSGRISIESATSVEIRAGNAAVEVGRASGECCIRTSAGRVEVGVCGSADVTTDSGRIGLLDVRGPVRAHCVSGRVEVGLTTADDVEAETVSGRITVTVPGDVEISRHEDQSTHVTWPDGSECRIDVRSVTGRIAVSQR